MQARISSVDDATVLLLGDRVNACEGIGVPLQYKFAKLNVAWSPALVEQLQTMETVHLSSLIRQVIKELRSLISLD